MDKFDKAHMRTANVYAKLSPAKRLKVGCILVKENRIRHEIEKILGFSSIIGLNNGTIGSRVYRS